jgi:endonuclease/exonuclease/phosphatase family metal-dependent hydrolase
VFISRRVKSRVRVMRAAVCGVQGVGSKGGVGVALKVGQTTLAFVTCHLEAKKNEMRRQQYRTLVQRMGRKLGEPGLDLPVQFHHVIWCGDLNYRCVSEEGDYLSSEYVVDMLQQGRNREVSGVGGWSPYTADLTGLLHVTW